MSSDSELHKKWSWDEDYRAAYDELGPERKLAHTQLASYAFIKASLGIAACVRMRRSVDA